jgi:hypothetical protein
MSNEIKSFKEFKNVAETCLTSGHLKAGGFSLNNGFCYIPTVNDGRGVTGGNDADLKKAWRYAKKNGSFSIYSSYFSWATGDYIIA